MANEGTFWVDEENGLLIVKDEEENEDKYVIEEEVKLDDNTYLILVPEEIVDEDDAEAFVLKMENEGDEQVLTVIEDESEFEEVKQAYMKMS